MQDLFLGEFVSIIPCVMLASLVPKLHVLKLSRSFPFTPGLARRHETTEPGKGDCVPMHPRTIRKPLVLVTLIVLLTVAQFGLGAPPASAGDHQTCLPLDIRKTSYPDATYDIEERCVEVLSYSGTSAIWLWEFSGVKPKRDDKENNWTGGKNSGGLSYTMHLEALLSDSRPGGAAAGRVIIAQADGSNLDRTIAVLVRTQHYTAQGWATCVDPGWKQASIARSMMQYTIDQGTSPDCGNGSNRTDRKSTR